MIFQSRLPRLIFLSALALTKITAAENQPDSAAPLFAGKVGFKAERVATENAAFYPYSVFGKLEYRGFDRVVPYTQLKHTQNKRIFDGLGNTETIGVTDFYLGAEWEIADKYLLDGFYRLGLGQSDYRADQGSLAAIRESEIADFMFALDYMRVSYIYPGTAFSILNQTVTPEFEVTFHATKALKIPVGMEYSAISYNTSDNYGLFLLHAGTDWKINEKLYWSIRLNLGKDSSDYSILGFNTKTRWKVWEKITLAFWLDYIRYRQATTAQTTSSGKKSVGSAQTSGKNNPLGGGDSFSYFILGLEISYAF